MPPNHTSYSANCDGSVMKVPVTNEGWSPRECREELMLYLVGCRQSVNQRKLPSFKPVENNDPQRRGEKLKYYAVWQALTRRATPGPQCHTEGDIESVHCYVSHPHTVAVIKCRPARIRIGATRSGWRRGAQCHQLRVHRWMGHPARQWHV